jgi:NADH:ubiquinone oxidoreductase subunit B-like Fe-S oxidoreductase
MRSKNASGTANKKNGIIFSRIQAILDWAGRASRAPMIWHGCCHREGFSGQVSSPAHADCLIIVGPVTKKALPHIRQLYQEMPAPRALILFGDCACNGGRFASSYAVITDVEKQLPVDRIVNGCPPSPEGLITALEKVRQNRGIST